MGYFSRVKLYLINLIATEETTLKCPLTMVVLFQWVHQGMNCMDPREYLQQNHNPSLHQNGFCVHDTMLPVGERERHEIVEDLSKEEDKQHKNLPFTMA
jgi:hypothetical protein